jgi:hypothetical protein
MRSQSWCAPALAALLLISPARAADEPTPEDIQKELGARQTVLAQQYRNFEQALVRLAARLEKSSREEDRARAVRLKKALELAGREDVSGRFDRLIGALTSSKALELQELKKALADQKMLASDIRTILALLLAQDVPGLTDEIATIRKILEELNRAIRDQKIVRIHTEGDKSGKETLGELQLKVTANTKHVAKMMRAPVEDKQPAEPVADTSRLAKGARKVKEATVNQASAYQNIQKGKNSDASNDQDQSIQKLVDARKQLEEILRQLREEERERVLAALHARCERMLQLQLAVYAGTIEIESATAKTAGKQPTRADQLRAIELSKIEDQIVAEATKAMQLLETEGSTIAWPEVFAQLRDDMRHVSRRLGKVDTGSVTQVIEKDIIATLRELVDALKKAEDSIAGGGGGGGGNPPPPDDRRRKEPPLIDELAELKMIRAMQVRVNRRTSTYSDRYPGEQAPEIKNELNNLAERQKRIADATSNVPKVKNP